MRVGQPIVSARALADLLAYTGPAGRERIHECPGPPAFGIFLELAVEVSQEAGSKLGVARRSLQRRLDVLRLREAVLGLGQRCGARPGAT